MPKNIYKNISIVPITELRADMKINAYLDLQHEFSEITQPKVLFLKKNFKGASLNVSRGGKIINTLADKVQIRDTVFQIYDFPKSLEKLTQVNPQLIKILSAKGFKKFKVHSSIDLPSDFPGTLKGIIESLQAKKPDKSSRPVISISDAPPNNSVGNTAARASQDEVEKASKIIADIGDHHQLRKEAALATEEFMDQARAGRVNKFEIESYVDSLTEKTSPTAMVALASLKKSDQTYAHCVDVAALFTHGYCQIKQKQRGPSKFSNEKEMMLGAFLHDFGKSEIPKYIIDSTSRFSQDSKEYKIIQNHPLLGARMLVKEMNAPKHIVNMALYHHVKPDRKMINSYPSSLDHNNAIYETRLLSIIDTYQALVGRRQYKKSWTPTAAIRYLDALAGLEYDQQVWNDFKIVMGTYPVGTLIELSDHSLAFVMAFSKKSPLRPSVVIVQNADGEMVSNHALINLVQEPALQIISDIDHFTQFGNKGYEIFKNINLN